MVGNYLGYLFCFDEACRLFLLSACSSCCYRPGAALITLHAGIKSNCPYKIDIGAVFSGRVSMKQDLFASE
jgi:hypothetical protein